MFPRSLQRLLLFRALFGLGLACASLLPGGCNSVGPATVARDRFDYSAAISDSWKRQTLLNIVKLRYLDPPIFVDVGQIVSGYTLETAASVGGSLPESNAVGGNTLNVGGSARFTDRPTITYVPLTGSKFISGLMTPLPPWALFHSMQSGWPADTILLLGTSGINGLSGETNTLSGVEEADERFIRVTHLMRSLQQSGMVTTRIVDEDKHQATLITIRRDNITDEAKAQATELRTLLGLDPDATEFKLVYGAMATNPREIAVATRSLIKVLGMLANHVDVPPEDITDGRATPGAAGAARHNVHFYSSKDEPTNAFVSVHYRDKWFWIDDRDLNTKRAFALIMLLFTMADPGGSNGMPVLTIPTS